MRAPHALALLLAVVGCADPAPLPGDAAPAVTIAVPAGPVHLAAQRGRTVVLQFADGDADAAWAALADVYADLEAGGAVVLGVSTDGGDPAMPFPVALDAEVARAFGYRGDPMIVVIDAEGVVRGQATPTQPDDVYALVAPVLLEMDAGPTGTAIVVDLRDASLREAEGAIRGALVTSLPDLDASALPADLGTEIVFVGPDGAEATDRAVAWGYGRARTLDGDARPPDAGPTPAEALPTRRGPTVRL